MACTRGKNQHERAHGIAITGNFQATSKRIPRDFHNSSLVSSCLLESSQRPEKTMQNLSQGRLQRFRNRLESGRGTLSNHPTMFLERLGAPLACPGSAPRVSKEAPGHQKERPGAPGSTSRRPESMPSRVWEWKHRVFPVRLLCEAASERFFIDFQRFFVFFANAANPRKCCACQQKQRFGFSRCESSRPCEGTSNNDRKRIQNRCRRSGISRISGISRASGGSGSSRISG